eukprot:TRINITY_DN22807_c0_g1_i1.p1 TRINITY_DN22807_c0_g1~~TRINITY_DN22807_c0_g1_i1.p1  ORF type:complete len:433 (+),score=42.71 TRINITY_DN22807_c0_g1_i1:47-1300(+)
MAANIIVDCSGRKLRAGLVSEDDDDFQPTGVVSVGSGFSVLSAAETESIWRRTFFEELKVTPEGLSEHNVMISIAPLTAREVRERMVSILVEQLGVRGVFQTTADVATLYSVGKTTGVAVHMGGSNTSVVPVYEGFPLYFASKMMNLGGDDLLPFVEDLLFERAARERNNGMPSREVAVYENLSREIAKGIKDKLCYVALDSEAERAGGEKFVAIASAYDEEHGWTSADVIGQAKFQFRAIPTEKLTAEDVRGPLLHFYTRDGSDGDDVTSRSLEGKASDFELSEHVRPYGSTHIGFLSHTRKRQVMDKKIERILANIKKVGCTHLWIDGACFPQARIVTEKLHIGFADLAEAVRGCQCILVDLSEEYSDSLWCIVEWVVWAHFKPGQAPIILEDGGIGAPLQAARGPTTSAHFPLP